MYNIHCRIHSSKLELGHIDIAGQWIKSDLRLSTRIEDHLVEEGVVCLAEIFLIISRDFPILVTQCLDHLCDQRYMYIHVYNTS